MQHKVVVVNGWEAVGPAPPDAERILGDVAEVRSFDQAGRPDEEALQAFSAMAGDAHALVFGPWRGIGTLAPAFWDHVPRLRLVAGTFDNRFEEMFQRSLRDARDAGITVIDTSRSMTPSVAEYTLAMLLNLVRDIPDAIATVRGGGWRGIFPEDPLVGTDLTGKRIGLAGFGVINRRLTELLAPFHCRIEAYDPFVADHVLEAAGVLRASSLVELASGCQLFVVGIPPTPATGHIISAEVIDALPAGSGFVLPTRMAVVEQEALWRRCAAGELRAAVDVFEPEPPPVEAPFRRDPNVLPTPHMAGNTTLCHRRCFTTACEEAKVVLAGGASAYEMTGKDADVYAGRAGTAS